MEAWQIAAIFVAGILSGGINALAGGGSLVSFPVLMLSGLGPITANATNTAAQWPGSLASTLAFKDRLRGVAKTFWGLMPATVIGSLLGAWLLLQTPDKIFDALIPVLILIATVCLLIPKPQGESEPNLPHWGVQVTQFLTSLYGGYFGAGMGIMMLAAFRHALEGEIHDHNALKNGLAVAINLVAAGLLIQNGAVVLLPALCLTLGSIAGGSMAGRWSQKLDPKKLRMGVVAYGFVMVAVFAARVLGKSS